MPTLMRVRVAKHQVQFLHVAVALFFERGKHVAQPLQVTPGDQGRRVTPRARLDLALDQAATLIESHAGMDGDLIVRRVNTPAPFVQRTGLCPPL